jgi:hypothetical protein
MALREPTSLTIRKAMRLCWLAMVDPTEFSRIEAEDSAKLETQPIPKGPRILRVREGLAEALVWSVSAVAVGFVFGVLGHWLFGESMLAVNIVGALGGAILLWATMAVRGWDVQTFSGSTLTERVNRWIFRALYWIGTALLVMAAGWNLMG